VGVSATVKRTDGADFLVEGAFGPLALVIPESKMVALGVIHAPKACFVHVAALDLKTTADIEKVWGSNPREGFYQEGIVRNLQRNQLVIELLLAFLSSPTRGGNALVLVERIEHGQELQRLLAARGKKVEFIEGTNTKDAVRDKWLEALKRQEIDALISSAILDEGVDIPGLEIIFNAAGGSCERAVVQRAGRPGRIDRVGSKTRCLYVDFDDQEPAFLNKNSRFRQLHINARFPDCVQKVSATTLKKIFNEP
jgi:superfamily II DNA or RNA helicase